MSGARRKSKNPQKWEESFSHVDLSNPVHKGTTTGNEQSIPYKAHSQGYADNYDYFPADAYDKESGYPEGEMTIQDVLQGSRQGFVAECKTCFIQLKDWSSTASHIQSHRLVFIPLCVRDSGSFSSKQPAMCMLCQEVCQNVSKLAYHAHSKHNLTTFPFVCPFCGRSFQSCSLLQKHIDVREVCLKCPVCSATYDQIYELFSHLSDCLPTFHPHLKSLVCHVCKHRILMGSLAEHMMHHSLQGHEVQQAKSAIPNSSSPTPNWWSEPPPPTPQPHDSSLRNVFLCEICDGRFSCFDTFRRHLFDHVETKMYCPSCFLKGFERPELVVRHLMLRCPRRSPEQFEFGSVISLIGKEKRMNFLQVIRDILHLRPFREGLLAWSQFPIVREVLLNVDKLLKDTSIRSNSPTDICLLNWLSDFEKEIQKQHPEVCGAQSKEEKNRNYQPHEPNKVDISCSPVIKVSTDRNIDTLDGIPTCLNSKPSAKEIRKNYPGVTLLHDVDVKRLKPLYEEALALTDKDVISPFIDSDVFTANDFLRLEWEAQYLRDKEPFYVTRGQEWRKFSPLSKKSSAKIRSSDVDPETVQKVLTELKELQKENTPLCNSSSFKQSHLDALLREACF